MLHTKSQSHQPSGSGELAQWFLRKLCFNILMGLQYERPSLKLWNLFIAIVTIDKTYQVRIMTLASIVFKKSTFQNFPI